MRNKRLNPASQNSHCVPLRNSLTRPERPVTLQPAREKITRVFRYLEALNQHRNPVQRELSGQLWSVWLHDLPVHPSIQRGVARLNPPAAGAQDASAQSSEESFVFKVRRPKLSPPPDPPKQITLWLKEGWEDPARKAACHEIRPQLAIPGETGETDETRVSFAADPVRPQIFRRWQLQRDEWANNEKPARAAMKIFEALYELHGRLEREAERVELILGDGILSWHRAEGNIYHPVLLQRLQLQFNAAVPEFTLSESEHPVELYSALFQTLSDVDGRAIGRCREELEHGGHHPLGDEATTSFFKRLVVQLSPRGEFVEDGAPKGEQDEPSIGRDPIVFLRARTLGYAAAIEGVLEDLRSRRELPWSLLNIVGEAAPIFPDDAADETTASSMLTLCPS